MLRRSRLWLLPGTVAALRDVWEATSFQIERLQAAEATVAEEQAGQASRTAPKWSLSFTPQATAPEKMAATDKVRPAPACNRTWHARARLRRGGDGGGPGGVGTQGPAQRSRLSAQRFHLAVALRVRWSALGVADT